MSAQELRTRKQLDIGAPVLETPRLLLRAHRYEDLTACIAMWSDPQVVRFIGGRPSSEHQTWMRVLNYAGHWAMTGFGYWAIEDQQTRQFVGEVGFADFKRPIDESMRGAPELGFALTSSVFGRGYATEAVAAVTAWADVFLPFSKTVALIQPDHVASLRVVEKNGYQVFERATFNEQPALFLARPRSST